MTSATTGRAASESGFSLVELMVASVVMLLVLGTAFTAMQNLSDAADGAVLTADVNTTLRSALNLMTRDLLATGRGIPVGGIPVPSGAGAAALVRPSPGGDALAFPADLTTLPAVSTGDGLGPAIGAAGTDMVALLVADTSLPLNTVPLTHVAADGATVTVDPLVPIDGPADGVTAGDLIMFTNALGNAVQMATGRTGQTIRFDPGDAMNLNQRGAGQGTILQLQSAPGVYPPTTATRVLLISYYIDDAKPERPMLIRRINFREGRAIGVAVENLQITFDLVDGVTNPANVPVPIAPNTPHQIRKANVFVAGRSYRAWTRTGEAVRSSLSTQISLRSLSFMDRYQ